MQTSAKPIGGVSSLTDQGGNSHGHHAATDGRLPRLLMSVDRDSHVRPPRLFHVRRHAVSFARARRRQHAQLGSALLNNLNNRGSTIRDWLVLPEAQCQPPCFFQCGIDFSIALYISGDFGRPVRLVRLRLLIVLRASVPEAAVDEHRHLSRAKHDVSSAPDAREGALVNPVAQTGTVQQGTQSKLRLGVSALVPLHGLAVRRRRGPGAVRRRPDGVSDLRTRCSLSVLLHRPESCHTVNQGVLHRLLSEVPAALAAATRIRSQLSLAVRQGSWGYPARCRALSQAKLAHP